MLWRLSAILVLSLGASLGLSPAASFAAEVQTATYGAMTLSDGYRMTVRHDGTHLAISWRPLNDGSAPAQSELRVPETAITATLKSQTLAPIAGSQAALLALRAHIFVVLDTADERRLFDQLAAIRVMLAAADFERQTWSFYLPHEQTAPLAEITSVEDLAQEWGKLRALLSTEAKAPPPKTLAPIIQQLGARSGDRKGLVLPQSLIPVLQPGLSPQGIAGMQAFGISLYPMTGALTAQQKAAYITLAGATGGDLLPWLDIPPSAYAAINAFAPLTQGGTVTYVMPPPPRRPWKTPDPIVLTLAQDGDALFRLDVPRPASTWAQLPWAVIMGLAIVFALCGFAAFMWFRRQNRQPLYVQLLDLSTQKTYEISRWPTTLGRSEGADITIANAYLKPLHIRLSDNGTGVEIRAISQGDEVGIDGNEAVKHSVYGDCDFTLGGLAFRLTFHSPAP